MQTRPIRATFVDKALSCEFDLTKPAEASRAFDLLEQGGPGCSHIQFVLESDAESEGVEVQVKVTCCDTEDGPFVDASIVLSTKAREDGEDMSFCEPNCHTRRFVKFVPSVVAQDSATATGKARVFIKGI